MYNAFKFKKDKKEQSREASKVKPLYETNPEKAIQKRNQMSENARIRRQEWIEKVNLEDQQFKGKLQQFINFYSVFEYAENDSLAYKTQFFDFRDEKHRDKTLDVSPLRFTISTFKTAKERAQDTEREVLKGIFKETYTKKEEMRNQVLRPVEKSKNSIMPFQ